MAITVKDIQEKVFPTQAMNGYDVEQVDDFLDEITEQLSALIRENLLLKGQITKLEEEVAAKDQQLASSPDYNEEGYFKNLQSTMRDTLISAQRVADDTVASAKAEAEKTVNDALAEADKIVTKADADAKAMTERAQNAADAAKAEYESLKAAAESYRASFRKLVEDQLQVLKAGDILFK
ncbi:MAG: DivIVA domain-containing protein [Clostridia bacterium]|nr:DivIVA domain-containing protein [Clostridia bacterium]